MKEPKFPENENQRLKALYDLEILDTNSDRHFDRLTRTAKLTFDIPIVLISLVDKERQWFKSKDGIEDSELPRRTSFCGHAILQDDLFVIPDTFKDKRFSDNPLVLKKPNIRFYAGYPISTPDNFKVGTFCMIDEKPRRLHKNEVEIFKNLSLIVEHNINYFKLATVDNLTNILNRRGFVQSTSRRLNLCKEMNINAILTLINLDNFKLINDNFGTAKGDNILLTFSNLMKQYLDQSDIFARLGDSQFAILSSGKNNEIIRYKILGFQRKLEQYNRERNLDYNIEFSSKIVNFDPEQHRNIHDLLSSGHELMHNHE